MHKIKNVYEVNVVQRFYRHDEEKSLMDVSAKQMTTYFFFFVFFFYIFFFCFFFYVFFCFCCFLFFSLLLFLRLLLLRLILLLRLLLLRLLLLRLTCTLTTYTDLACVVFPERDIVSDNPTNNTLPSVFGKY